MGLLDRYSRPGQEPSGDEQVGARNISINFDNSAMSDALYYGQLNSIWGMFRRDLAPFYLVDSDNDRQALIRLLSMSDRPASEGLVYRLGDNNLELAMLDGAWEDVDQIVSGPTSLDTNDTVVLSNESNELAYPEIEVSVNDANPDLTIENVTTGQLMRISDAAVVPGAVLKLYSTSFGKVSLVSGLGSVELSNSLADGSGFIYLLPGSNTIRYTSIYGGADVTIAFRRKYVW